MANVAMSCIRPITEERNVVSVKCKQHMVLADGSYQHPKTLVNFSNLCQMSQSSFMIACEWT